MSSKIKKHIINKIYENVLTRTKLATVDQIVPFISLNRRSGKTYFNVQLPLTIETENEREFSSTQFHYPNILPDKIIQASELGENLLKLDIDETSLLKDVLDSNPIKLNFKPIVKNVVVEFSSPNVAKPFHAGHLRSTIIGNFISNIKQKVGCNVTRINYLGDWGTQFGLLKLGVDKLQISDEDLKASPTKTLYDAYVWINRQAETDVSLNNAARDEFRKLEERDQSAIDVWSKFLRLTTDDLQQTYSRLGIKFDEYQWESNFGKTEVNAILERLNDQGLLEIDTKERKCARIRDRLVPLVRSDGASLYLARDVAAAIHRRRTTQFREMLYIVENGQSDHFLSLFEICRELGLDESWNMKHIKFGRIHGMSTRKGNAIFLSEILDHARELVMERLKASKTTKVEPSLELADALGSAAVIINDLKQRRIKDYEFNWEKALQMNGDTAIRLQYTHCRLCSLIENSLQKPAIECDAQALSEPEAISLAFEISRFEEIILKSHADLEACILVNYLFHLTHAANKAFKVLTVKGTGAHLASQRLLLFNAAKMVLADGLQLLGIVPLEKM